MIILTLKERRLIDEAVFKFGEDREIRIWRDWTHDHPDVRYDPASPADDGRGQLPSHVANVAVSALGRLERFLRTRIDSVEVSDDEAADLCNDVAEIHSTTEAIRPAA
jgi:hypothetical protein